MENKDSNKPLRVDSEEKVWTIDKRKSERRVEHQKGLLTSVQ